MRRRSTEAGIGENHEPETHLIPNVLRSCLSDKLGSRLKVFGNDYETRDGTASAIIFT